MLVPKKLMDLIGAGRDVVLAGQDGRIEIWAADEYEKIVMPAEDYAALAENLMGEINNEPEG
jgi:MraZ protein